MISITPSTHLTRRVSNSNLTQNNFFKTKKPAPLFLHIQDRNFIHRTRISYNLLSFFEGVFFVGYISVKIMKIWSALKNQETRKWTNEENAKFF